MRFAVLLAVGCFSLTQCAAASDEETPKLADDRLAITLFAESPDIVTPIGMTIDARDRVFVIESHTHQPPADYDGPPGDRIKVFVDEDNDGHADQVTVFAEGIQQAMNLAFSPDGDLYVVCAREVLRLPDENDDGKCDAKQRVLKLDTRERYAHNSWLGITFDTDGWMYVARGNTGSHAYRIEGPDGSFVAGYGDGGNVIRCRSDGSKLSEFATGFWNPFDVKFDHAGRLLLVDNDPDARGPNRLLHVVRGGDYGYKSVYGGGGNHPFQGWDGSLPGTLPFIAGTGEAPSGLIDCRHSSLPPEYANSVLVTVWNENSIERFDLKANGASVTSNGRIPFLTGGKDFRPVAIDCDRRGNLFVTDWVLVNYPNHGRGRIWRISNPSESKLKPLGYFDRPEQSQPVESSSPRPNDIVDRLESDDAFRRHAAIMELSQPKHADRRRMLMSHKSEAVRLGALLATKRSDRDSNDVIRLGLSDADEPVRIAALMWAGELLDTSLRGDLDTALKSGPVGAVLLETYLAAVENLTGEFADNFKRQTARRSNTLTRTLPDGLLVTLAKNDTLADPLRALAVARFSDGDVASHREWLRRALLARGQLASAVTRRLAHAPEKDLKPFADLLTTIALDESQPAELRCDALFAIRQISVDQPERFVSLLRSVGPSESVAIEAARTLRSWSVTRDQKLIDSAGLSAAVVDRLAGPVSQLAKSASEWQSVLATGGDPARGRRVFFSASVGCSKCHTIGGRGGTLGPDLGGVARSRSRSQIIDSILNPSAEFAPQYQAWLVVTTNGKIHRGLQLDHKSGGKINLTLDDGRTRTFAADEIEDYIASPNSLMPTGLEMTMTVAEFRDLVAFLTSPTK